MPRGKKTCPKCSKETGPRTKVCECGFDFFAAASPAPQKYSKPPVIRVKETLTQPVQGGTIFDSYVHTPAGEPEFKFHTLDHNEIVEWAEKTKEGFRKQNKHLSLTGLMYYCKMYFAPKFKDKMAYEKMIASLCRVQTYDNLCDNCKQEVT